MFTGGIKLDRFADYTLLSDGKTLTLYVDKSWVNSKPLPRNIGVYYTSNDVYIGKRPASGYVFRGHLCRVNIKNYPISKCWRPARPAIAVVKSSVRFVQYAPLPSGILSCDSSHFVVFGVYSRSISECTSKKASLGPSDSAWSVPRKRPTAS